MYLVQYLHAAIIPRDARTFHSRTGERSKRHRIIILSDARLRGSELKNRGSLAHRNRSDCERPRGSSGAAGAHGHFVAQIVPFLQALHRKRCTRGYNQELCTQTATRYITTVSAYPPLYSAVTNRCILRYTGGSLLTCNTFKEYNRIHTLEYMLHRILYVYPPEFHSC